jgi:hypothetical protein
MECHPGIANIYPRLGISSDCGSKRLGEPGLELPDCPEPVAKLAVDSWPRYFGSLFKAMKTPSKPDIDIQTHGTVA